MPISSVGIAAGVRGGDDNPQSMSTIVVPDDAVGSHVLVIDGYSERNTKQYFKSGMFNVGGHAWCITYFPQGDATANADWISLHLTLVHTQTMEVKVHVAFSLLDNTGEPASPYTMARDMTFTDSYYTSGFPLFIQRKALEESPYLVDDCFSVRCDVMVKNRGGGAGGASRRLIAVPPSDMNRHIGDLLSSLEGVDVTFEVDGETFRAHRLMLAARSSEFKVELFGVMKEKDMSHIRIDNMEASVFKAMLHFIYNDALPKIEQDDMPAMAQHLLVAADRYGLHRLKLICEDKLWYNINTDTLPTTLALAEQHCCHGLKDACFQFLKTTRNLKAVMESPSYKHLIDSFPSFLAELAAKLAL